MKLITVDDLSDALTRDMTWRIREISDLKQGIRLVPEQLRQTSARAAVPILYAHWEGHVRVCATSYVRHISNKRLKYKELYKGYMLAALRSDLDRLGKQAASKVEQISLISRVFEVQEARFSNDRGYLVDTRSNLSYSALSEILAVIGLKIDVFTQEETFIDKILLDKRNNIAHGQDVSLPGSEIDEIADRTIGLMRSFRNIVENAALLAEYRC